MSEYLATCFDHGGIIHVGPDHPLYEECVQREADGFLDALPVKDDPENCWECRRDQERLDSQNLSYWQEVTDPNSMWFDDSDDDDVSGPTDAAIDAAIEERNAMFARKGIPKKCWDCPKFYLYDVYYGRCTGQCPAPVAKVKAPAPIRRPRKRNKVGKMIVRQ